MAGTTNEVVQPQQQQYPSATEQEKGPTVLVRSDSGGSSSSKEEHQQTWRPGFWHQFPTTGIGALVGIIICSVCAVVIIATSNGKAKSEWKLHAAPNVLVNIFSAVASVLVTMAVGQGIAISWWRRAMRGTTVQDLHFSWSFGSSMMSLVTGWKFWNVMALTALCTKFAIIDSTLFQKALSTRTALGPSTQIQAPVYPLMEFPPTGTLNEDGNATASMNFAMTWDTLYWTQSDTSIDSYDLNGFFECAGLCDLTYRGVGFESICTMTNVSADRSQEEVGSGAPNANLQMDVGFEQRWPTSEKNYSWISMQWTSWSSDLFNSGDNTSATCGGRFVNLSCELRPSVIDYPISMRNSSYSKREAKSKDSEFYIFLGPLNDTAGTLQGLYYIQDFTTERQVPNFTVVNNIDVQEQQIPGGNTSIGGIVYALQNYYASRSTVSYDNTTLVDPTTGKPETAVQPILKTTGMLSSLNQLADTGDGCPTSYTFDYNSMLQSINTLMVLVSDDVFLRPNYTGDWGAYDDYYNNYTDDTYRMVNATQFKDETYYVSRMAFAWGALASTLVVVALILPSYWKFWELGRKVTLGPFEIANAFEAPAFSHVHRGAGHVDGVIAAVGKEKVQYGAREHEVHGNVYGFKRPGDAV